jgi:hypothetical protein
VVRDRLRVGLEDTREYFQNRNTNNLSKLKQSVV